MRFGTAIERLVDNYEYAKSKIWIRDEVAWALYHTWKEADDCKIENNSEKPNNCEEPSDECKKCKHLKHISNYGWDCEFEFFEDCNYEPKDEPQTKCYLRTSCDHYEDKQVCGRCREYNLYSHTKDEPQTDCNKLINAVVKLDMSREDKFKVIELLERHCEKCKHYLFTDIDGYYCEHETYGQPCNYEPKDEPQIECENCKHYGTHHPCELDFKACRYEPKDEPRTEDLQDWKDRMWAEAVIEPQMERSK